MPKKLVTLMVIIFLILPVFAGVSAQDTPSDTTIQPCDQETIEEINDIVERGVRLLLSNVEEMRDDAGVAIIVRRFARAQKAYWDDVNELPRCAETYTRAYEAGRAIDYATTAASLTGSLLAEADNPTGEDTKRLKEIANLIFDEAVQILKDNLPDIDDILQS